MLAREPFSLGFILVSIGVGCGSGDALDYHHNQSTSLRVDISAHKESVTPEQTAVVDVAVTNVSEHPVRVLASMIPSSDLQESIFSIERDGRAVDYMGLTHVRPAPQEDDYVIVSPGESIGGRVDLSQLYDMSLPGMYEISVELDVTRLLGGKTAMNDTENAADVLTSNALELEFDGQQTDAENGMSPHKSMYSTRTAKIDQSCDKKQKKVAKDALREARESVEMGIFAVKTAEDWPESKAARLFGRELSSSFQKNKHTLAQKDLKSILGKLNSMTLFCHSDSSKKSYVERRSGNRVHLHRDFWKANDRVQADKLMDLAGKLVGDFALRVKSEDYNDFCFMAIAMGKRKLEAFPPGIEHDPRPKETVTCSSGVPTGLWPPLLMAAMAGWRRRRARGQRSAMHK